VNHRTARHSITFAQPFGVTGVEQEQPAGTYLIETDEELIEGLSFSAYRRTSTRIRLAADPRRPGIEEIVEINCPFITARLAAEAARE
jgi:hypothetical protein